MIAAASIPTRPLIKEELFASLPPPWFQDPLPAIRDAVLASQRKIVVLDDDPTGTQTVHDTPVLTEWTVEALTRELAGPYPVFYILTNTRSLFWDEAAKLNREIASNLKEAGNLSGRSFAIVSRSDSTLRGHFPVETDALAHTLGLDSATVLLIPFFEAGGRFTIDNMHYVAQDDLLVPAAQTAFANDATFGYRTSNLCEWVAEKTAGRIPAKRVASISIEEIRVGGPQVICQRLLAMTGWPVCVVNAVSQRDLEVFSQGLLAAEQKGRKFLYRSAASFVAARSGMALRPLLNAEELSLPATGPELIIAGSHVPQTSKQLQHLKLTVRGLVTVEMQVPSLLSEASRSSELNRVKSALNEALQAGSKTLLYTSRNLFQSGQAEESLAISRRVSDALVNVAQSISVRPRYLIAKGGITSSDIATRGLGVKKALVRGQLLPGVPVWELGNETRFSGLKYIVFPGNVGGPDAVTEAVLKLEKRVE